MTTHTAEARADGIGFYGWKNAWLLFFIYMAAAGFVFYAYTVIFPEMIEATGWDRGDASIASSLNMLMMGFLVPLVAIILKRIGSRRAITVGLLLLFVGLLLLGTVTVRMWHWIVLWGVMVPVAAGLCGLFPVQITVMSWFVRRRATVIGFVMTGAALGGSIVQPAYTWVIQSTGQWETGWLLSSGCVLVALCLSFRVRSKPSDIGQFPDGLGPTGRASTGNGTSMVDRVYRTPAPWEVREVFRTRTAWLITGVMVPQAMTTILINTHGRLHITDIGYSRMQGATVLMFVILGSGIARLPMGWLGDRIEPRYIVSGALLFMLISFMVFWRGSSFGLLVASGSVFGICFGTLLVMLSTMIANYFGTESYASISACISPFLTVIGAAIPTTAGYAADRLGSYDVPFAVLSAALFLSIIFSLFLSPPRRPKYPRGLGFP